ncbi:ribosomal L7Ae/L30e/S12e/Gadd45 family protein [archaeon]|nr:ribosomal L7Ae/L30e/S12e/Gadd45 family protein [archaeon]
MKELREAVKNKEVVLGTEKTIKLVKLGKAKKVYVCSNPKQEVLEDLEHYTTLHKISLVKLKEDNEELGLICKKPFSVSVLCIK